MISNDPTLAFANIFSRLKTESKAYYVLFLRLLKRIEIKLVKVKTYELFLD